MADNNYGDGMYLKVLGCGSAMPKPLHQHSAQLLRLRDKHFLIDCGEGTQMQILRYGGSWANLHRIFITHLHGDHCLGLPGLLSTMSMSGLSHPVHIYGPEGLEQYVAFIISTFCHDDADRIIPHTVDHRHSALIYSDASIRVTAFPLRHRVPCIGYRFDEQPRLRHLDRAMADYYGIPMAYFGILKQGQDFIHPDGTVIPNEMVTTSPRTPFSYAYCSDTAYQPSVIEMVRGVDLLYHETTYGQDMRGRAEETLHSTTIDAAKVAIASEVGHLLIGHYSARYSSRENVQVLLDETQAFFPRTIASEDGLTLDFEKLREEIEY